MRVRAAPEAVGREDDTVRPNILVVDSREAQTVLEEAGWVTIGVEDVAAARRWLGRQAVDCVVTWLPADRAEARQRVLELAGAAAGSPLIGVLDSPVALRLPGLFGVTTRTGLRERLSGVVCRAIDLAAAARSGAERRRLLMDAFAYSDEPTAVVDGTGGFLAVNPALCELLGLSEAGLLGLELADVVVAEDGTPAGRFPLAAHRMRGEVAVWLSTSECGVVGASIRVSAVASADGSADSFVVVFRHRPSQVGSGQRAAVAELAVIALETSDRTALVERTLGLVGSVLSGQLTALVERDGDDLVALVCRGVDRPETASVDASSAAGLALAGDDTLRIDDLEADQRVAGPVLFGEDGLGRAILAPVVVEGHPAAVLATGWWKQGTCSADEVAFVELVANILAGALTRLAVDQRLRDTGRRTDRLLRFERALGACARALLVGEQEDPLQQALVALHEATNADLAFIERNVTHPDLGLVSETVRHVSKPGLEVDGTGYWSFVPWAKMPDSRAVLERGQPFELRVSQLGEVEKATYLEDPYGIVSELDLPIMVRGTWRGLVGFAYAGEDKDWDPQDVQLLETAAQMIASYWDRQEASDQLADALARTDHRLRYEHALTRCAQALLMSSDDTAVDVALSELLRATAASYGFVDRLEEDPVAGPTLVKQHTVAAPGLRIEDDDREFWARVPLSCMPTAADRLLRGQPYHHNLDELSGEELGFYLSAPYTPQSDLKIPVFVGGKLLGVIGFSDQDDERNWHRDDIRLLETAARMIGAYWERGDAQRRLEELVRSKDEFVASVSHELRTPLTAVVGLAQELRHSLASFAPAEIEEFIGLIADQSTEVAHIVQDLLVAARSDIDKVTVVLEPVDVRAAITGVLAGLPESQAAEIEVSGEADLKAMADSSRVRQIMRNLVTNAVRYGGERKEITIAAAGDQVVVEVTDDGAGVPLEHRESIFEAYHRAHDRSGQPASVGLGLTVSRQLARLMEGDIEYDQAGGRSIFRLTLPVA